MHALPLGARAARAHRCSGDFERGAPQLAPQQGARQRLGESGQCLAHSHVDACGACQAHAQGASARTAPSCSGIVPSAPSMAPPAKRQKGTPLSPDAMQSGPRKPTEKRCTTPARAGGARHAGRHPVRLCGCAEARGARACALRRQRRTGVQALHVLSTCTRTPAALP